MTESEFAKSSHSSGNGECVEVARNVPGAVAVRDSKGLGEAVLRVGVAAWGSFLAYAKGPAAGERSAL